MCAHKFFFYRLNPTVLIKSNFLTASYRFEAFLCSPQKNLEISSLRSMCRKKIKNIFNLLLASVVSCHNK